MAELTNPILPATNNNPAPTIAKKPPLPLMISSSQLRQAAGAGG
jgi:hypothetical protein